MILGFKNNKNNHLMDKIHKIHNSREKPGEKKKETDKLKISLTQSHDSPTLYYFFKEENPHFFFWFSNYMIHILLSINNSLLK